jgi:hypothetical protein
VATFSGGCIVSRFDYEQSKRINQEDYTFAALVMAAMRKADTMNGMLLAKVFPSIDAELRARYNAPGGRLETDRD